MSATLPASRRQMILDLVYKSGEVQVGALSEVFGVAAITVRRDIAALAGEGLVEQVRGGARRLAAPAAGGPVGSRSGAPGSRPTIAMVVPSLRYYWPTIVHGAAAAAERLGVELEVHASTSNAEANLLVVEQIAERSAIDALIIAPEMRAGSNTDRLIERLAALPFPVVLAERGVDGYGSVDRMFDAVRTDHSLGAAMAVRHLVNLGHRRIAFEADPQSPTSSSLLEGYERACRLLGLEAVAAPGRIQYLAGEHPFGEIDDALLRYAEAGTTAVLVHPDFAATLLLQHAIRRGLRVPADLSLISYDDEFAVDTKPALTAVAPAKRALGERAVELALRRIEHRDGPVEQVFLLPTIHERESTGARP